MYNDSRIFGNRFVNNTAIAGGIVFQNDSLNTFASYSQVGFNSTREDGILIKSFWSDMANTDGTNSAAYGPLVAGVVKTLKCVITDMDVSNCSNISSRDPPTSGNFYNDESLYVSGSQVTCCLFDIFGQVVQQNQTPRRRKTAARP